MVAGLRRGSPRGRQRGPQFGVGALRQGPRRQLPAEADQVDLRELGSGGRVARTDRAKEVDVPLRRRVGLDEARELAADVGGPVTTLPAAAAAGGRPAGLALDPPAGSGLVAGATLPA